MAVIDWPKPMNQQSQIRIQLQPIQAKTRLWLRRDSVCYVEVCYVDCSHCCRSSRALVRTHPPLRALACKLSCYQSHRVPRMELQTQYRERMLQNACQVHTYFLVQVAESPVEAPSVGTQPALATGPPATRSKTSSASSQALGSNDGVENQVSRTHAPKYLPSS